MNLMIIKIMIKPYDNTFTTDIFVYTDGACSNNGRENAMAGLGVYFGKSDERNISKRVCGRQTNNTAELSALIEAYKVLESEIEAGKKYCILFRFTNRTGLVYDNRREIC